MRALFSSLQFQLVIGIILGAFCGLFFGEYCHILEPVGTAFIMLLKMSVLPLMSFSLIHAVGKLNQQQAKWLLKRSCLALLTVWAMALSVIYSVSVMFPHRSEGGFFSELPVAGENQTDLLALFIPTNPIHAFANDVVPAVVFFSLLFGLALMGRRNKSPLLDTLQVIVKALIRITDWVTRLSPIGVFALIANTAGTMPFGEFEKIKLYFIAYVVGILLLVFLLIPLMVRSVTPVSGKRFLQEMRPAMLLAFTTGNTLISLPHIMKGLETLVGEVRTNKERAHSAIESVVPIAYNFPTVGNLFSLLFILFLSFFYAIPFGFEQLSTLGTLGIPVLFGSGNSIINAVAFLIDQLRLPVDGLALFLETMPLTRNFQMLGSSTGIATVGILATLAAIPKGRRRWIRLARNFALSFALLLAVVTVIRWIDLSPPKEQEVFSTLNIEAPADHKFASGQTFRRAVPGKDTLDLIQESNVLRIGYSPFVKPFAYMNQEGDLVGFDIALAHDLAKTLGVSLEFVPLNFGNVEQELEEGKYDIAMSALSISPKRMLRLLFTSSYIESQRILVLEDYRRHELGAYPSLKQDESLKLATLKGSLEQAARALFPNAQLQVLDNPEQFMDSDADAMLWSQTAATTWTLTHPKYMTITTNKDMGKEYYGYAFAPSSARLHQFVELWLEIRKADGRLHTLQDTWVEGHTPRHEPRWSIIRNVLEWVD